MALFVIRRDAPGSTQEVIDAASWRAIACAVNYPGLRWLHSYWDTSGQLFCVYEAEDESQIREHARQSRIPCDEVISVVVVRPEHYTGENPSLTFVADSTVATATATPGLNKQA
jgi:hypothetical protein